MLYQLSYTGNNLVILHIGRNDHQLRSRLIRLAAEKPELRPHLLPLLQKQSSDWSLDENDFLRIYRSVNGGQNLRAIYHIVGGVMAAMVGKHYGEVQFDDLMKIGNMVQKAVLEASERPDYEPYRE